MINLCIKFECQALKLHPDPWIGKVPPNVSHDSGHDGINGSRRLDNITFVTSVLTTVFLFSFEQDNFEVIACFTKYWKSADHQPAKSYGVTSHSTPLHLQGGPLSHSAKAT